MAPLKFELADDERRPADPPPPRKQRRGVATQRAGFTLAVASFLAFWLAAFVGDALLGGRGRAVLEDRIAAAVRGPQTQEITVGAIHR